MHGTPSPVSRCLITSAAVVLVGIASQGCRDQGSSDEPCLDCIDVELALTLGTFDGLGALGTPWGVLRDRQDRVWIGQDGFLTVFDQSGEAVRQVGRQGKGPMEFSRPLPVRADRRGNVTVFDPGNLRVTVIDSQFRLATEWALPNIGGIHYWAPFPSSAEDYAVNIWSSSMGGVGSPVHVIRRDKVLASFGAPDSVSEMNDFTSLRILAVDSAGNVVVGKRFEHTLDVWSRDGRRLFTLTGTQLNAQEVQWGVYNLDDNPLPNEVLALHVDSANRVWVLIRRVRDRWREFVNEVTLTGGLRGVQIKEGAIDSVFYARLEVFDLSQRAIVAQRDVNAFLGGFLNTGDVFGNAMTEEGIPQVTIFDVRWEPR